MISLSVQPRGSWRSARLVSQSRAPSVVLISETYKERLWGDLIRCGGSGILIRPLESRRAFESLDFALARFSSPYARVPKGRAGSRVLPDAVQEVG
jgi:AmiR/NasT family two-component response regulator